MDESLKSWIEDCISEYEKQKNVKLSNLEKDVFYHAFEKGQSAGEDCGFLL